MPDQLVVVTAHAARIPPLWRTCWVRLVVDELAKRKITPETVRAAIELADQAIRLDLGGKSSEVPARPLSVSG